MNQATPSPPRLSRPKGFRPGIAASCAFLAAMACSADANEFRRVAVGDPAPEYAAPDLAGDTLSLASLRGEVVLLNVWATWCAPCRREMPGLQHLEDAYGDRGFRVLGVSIDARGAETAIRSFAQDLNVTFALLHDPDERVTRTFRTIGVPESFLIGRDGVVAARWIGTFDPTDEATRVTVETALASGDDSDG